MLIESGSKITHFKELHKKTGIPYSEMVCDEDSNRDHPLIRHFIFFYNYCLKLFFDDEHRNNEVEKLGKCSYLPTNAYSDSLTHKLTL